MTGATAAVALRLWGERDDWLARRLLWLMGVPATLALSTILLPAMMLPAGSVKLNLKFRITWAVCNLIMDICMTVFAVGIIKSRGGSAENDGQGGITRGLKETS